MNKLLHYLPVLLVVACNLGSATHARDSFSVIKDSARMAYNPMIFGHFIEHFDNQVYGGVFDLGNALSDEDGFRKDVIEALRKIRVPIVR